MRKTRSFRDPTVCERCGAVYCRKTWRTRETVDPELFSRAVWAICPACRQEERGEAFGRVLIRGAFAASHEDEIRRRIQNVADRAAFTQPERRLVDVRWAGDTLEILTTSQKLAHRIVSELRKAFHGRSSYAWSDRDGRLFATWERD